MIFVTGTKRSGTSMWMQILRGAGLPYLGEPFLAEWESSIVQANPRGFYESPLRQGVYHATNPDPRTGAFLAPGATTLHAVKVFIPGLVRSDLAYVHRVVATLRDWREYGASLRRLHALEDAWFAQLDAPDAPERHARAAASRSALPPEVEWWFENYDLVRDAATRQYPLHLTTYARLLCDPERTIDEVLAWLGTGDRVGALAAIEPALRTQANPPSPTTSLPPRQTAILDDLFATVDAQRPLSPSLLRAMNALQAELIWTFSAPGTATNLAKAGALQ